MAPHLLLWRTDTSRGEQGQIDFLKHILPPTVIQNADARAAKRTASADATAAWAGATDGSASKVGRAAPRGRALRRRAPRLPPLRCAPLHVARRRPVVLLLPRLPLVPPLLRLVLRAHGTAQHRTAQHMNVK